MYALAAEEGHDAHAIPGCLLNTTKTGGTMSAIVILYFSMLAQNCTGSNRDMMTSGAPQRKGWWRSLIAPL
jgi:hypothetical protein